MAYLQHIDPQHSCRWDVYSVIGSRRAGNHFKKRLAISSHMLLMPFPQLSRMPVGFTLGSFSDVLTFHTLARDFFFPQTWWPAVWGCQIQDRRGSGAVVAAGSLRRSCSNSQLSQAPNCVVSWNMVSPVMSLTENPLSDTHWEVLLFFLFFFLIGKIRNSRLLEGYNHFSFICRIRTRYMGINAYILYGI